MLKGVGAAELAERSIVATRPIPYEWKGDPHFLTRTELNSHFLRELPINSSGFTPVFDSPELG